jgi:hypothetical protein
MFIYLTVVCILATVVATWCFGKRILSAIFQKRYARAIVAWVCLTAFWGGMTYCYFVPPYNIVDKIYCIIGLVMCVGVCIMQGKARVQDILPYSYICCFSVANIFLIGKSL